MENLVLERERGVGRKKSRVVNLIAVFDVRRCVILLTGILQTQDVIEFLCRIAVENRHHPEWANVSFYFVSFLVQSLEESNTS